MKKLILLLALIASVTNINAQSSTFKNTACYDGENIQYNLYFNWQFVWVKVGSAGLTTKLTTYKGKQAFRSTLTTSSNHRLDNIFEMRDTLMGYSTLDMQPLFYHKATHESKYNAVDEAVYTYESGKTKVSMSRQKKGGTKKTNTQSFSSDVFDMISIFQRARSFDNTGWNVGHTIDISIVDGTKILPAKLKYLGKETVKADNGKKYQCLKLSYIEINKGKQKEIARFFVTDDAHHVPVRLDMNLRFGSAKAFLK